MSFYVTKSGNKLELCLKLNDYFKVMYDEYINNGLHKVEFNLIELELPDFFEYYDKESNVLTGFTYNCGLFHNGKPVNNIKVIVRVLTSKIYDPVNFFELYLNYLIENQNEMFDNTVDIIQTTNVKTVETIKSVLPIFEETNDKIVKLDKTVSFWKSISIIIILMNIFLQFF